APRASPEVGGVDDRHLHLLPADGVDLLADHLLDPLLDPEPERQQRVDAGAELPDVAGAHEQAVRNHLGLRRIVPQGHEEELRQAHQAATSVMGVSDRVTRCSEPRSQRSGTKARSRSVAEASSSPSMPISSAAPPPNSDPTTWPIA